VIHFELALVGIRSVVGVLHSHESIQINYLKDYIVRSNWFKQENCLRTFNVGSVGCQLCFTWVPWQIV